VSEKNLEEPPIQDKGGEEQDKSTVLKKNKRQEEISEGTAGSQDKRSSKGREDFHLEKEWKVRE